MQILTSSLNMKINFNSDDDLLLMKTLEFDNIIIVVSFFFIKTASFSDESLYKLPDTHEKQCF